MPAMFEINELDNHRYTIATTCLETLRGIASQFEATALDPLT